MLAAVNINFPEGAATSRLAELQGTSGGDIEMGGWDSDDSDDEEKTEQQGEALDQIEYQVRAAGEYVESGNADIRYAIKYQTELRRRYCCCCVIVLVVVAVVLIYLAVTNPRLFKKIK